MKYKYIAAKSRHLRISNKDVIFKVFAVLIELFFVHALYQVLSESGT